MRSTLWLVSKVGQSGLQSLTQLKRKEKVIDFFCGQNLFHVIYNHNPGSNGPLKDITFS